MHTTLKRLIHPTLCALSLITLAILYWYGLLLLTNYLITHPK